MTLKEEYKLSLYENVMPLGERGNVFLVKNTLTGELCVKKVLGRYNMDVYETLSKKQMPGTPRIYELIDADEGLVVIEQYIPGQTLDKKYPGENTPERVREVAIQVCKVLEVLHSQDPPIIHRDIKPDNIIAQDDGKVYLVDFDISRQYRAGADKRDTVVMGTDGYAAPEQWGFSQSDEKTDIYALGAVMKHMLHEDAKGSDSSERLKEFKNPDNGCQAVGAPQMNSDYGAGNSDRTKAATKTDNSSKFEDENKEDKELEKIIQKCMEMDPKNRYESAQALLLALQSKGKPIAGKRWLPPGFRSGKWYKALVAVLGYALIIYGSFFTSMSGSDRVENVTIDIAAFVYLIVLILLWFNWMGMADSLPLTDKNIPLRILMLIVYSALLLLIAAVMSALVLGLFG